VDVTERELARQELDRKDEQLRQVLDALQAAVYMTDAAGKITYVNRAAVELVGREPNIGQDEWCVTYRLFTPEGEELPPDPRHALPYRRALASALEARARPAALELSDQGTRAASPAWFRSYRRTGNRAPPLGSNLDTSVVGQ
jgi:PAS domain-containing protein